MLRKKNEIPVVLQQDTTDCGVACLLSVVKYYGGDSSLNLLRTISGTSKKGTTLLGLYQAAKEIGFDVNGRKVDIEYLKEGNEPKILHVLLPNNVQHYIICYGYRDGRFEIVDPASGRTEYSESRLRGVWKSQSLLDLKPNSNFTTIKGFKKAKQKWFLDLLNEDWRLIIFSLVLGIMTSAFGLLLSVFSQKLIDEIIPSRDLFNLRLSIVLLGLLLIIGVLIGVFRDKVMNIQTKDFNNRIVNSFFDVLLNLNQSFFDSRKIGDLVARLNDTQRVQKVIRLIVGNFIINIIVFVLSIITIFSYSYQSGLIVMMAVPFYFILIYRFNNVIIKLQKATLKNHSLVESNFINTISFISDIKTFNLFNFFRQKNSDFFSDYQKEIYDLRNTQIKLNLINGVFSTILISVLLIYISTQVFFGFKTIGELTAILGLVGIILPAMSSLALVFVPLNEAKVAFDRMYEFTQFKKEKNDGSKIDNFDKLTVDSLNFGFQGQSILLKNVHFRIEKGEFVAIIGSSGSGKSTFGKIIQMSYLHEEGEIVINDLSIKNIQLSSWRNLIGVVPQFIALVNGTIKENIVFGSEITDKDMYKFCSTFKLNGFIEQFPSGLNTLIGEEGINISGGQRQIVGLLRALFKRPQLLILDEFSSNLDPVLEKMILSTLQILKDQIGVVFITHKRDFIDKMVDRTYLLENQEFVEI